MNNTDLKFFTNEPERDLYSRFAAILKSNTQFFDVLVGYFIKQWEDKNTLDSSLSKSYGSCLEFLVQNNLVYESDWTSYGNPREYSLCPSLQEFLFNCPVEIAEKLQKIKDAYYCNLPF